MLGLFLFSVLLLSDQINVLLKWCFCKTGGKGKSCRLHLNSCDRPVTNLHFSATGMCQRPGQAGPTPKWERSTLRSIPRLSLLGMQGTETFTNTFYSLALLNSEEKLSSSSRLTSTNQNLNLRCVSTSGERGEHSPAKKHLADGVELGPRNIVLVSHKLWGHLFYKIKWPFPFLCSHKGKEKVDSYLLLKNIFYSAKKKDGYIGKCIK